MKNKYIYFCFSAQPLHPVQRDGEHLEPSVGLPALLLSRRVQHGGGAAGRRRLQRGLRHLLHRTLLPPGEEDSGSRSLRS